ncbi:DUF2092 domain-containing protein [Deefgea salmonis]|uniref:DUF2092 domain-containing protein n=1 Tax=Deefgea salmonis TaxID=2875502 RepID=A0ABS8BL10_9NEIS|nr:DUF2092 domain-containing protein [Deefgea salmonis]MCB5196399.1 DUF2092 domain-containing protein [Deefgea salmonis]
MQLKTCWFGLALLPLSVSLWASDSQPTEVAVNPLVVAKAVEIGRYLRSLPKAEVKATVTQDILSPSGQMIQTMGNSAMTMDGNNKLYVKINSDNLNREYFYNGKQLTQYSPTLHYYTTVDVADNTSDMLNQVENYYALNIPLKSLFDIGKDQSALNQLTLAEYVGVSKINGQLCDHLVFAQEKSVWQLWTSRNKPSLPCKVLITDSSQPNRPARSETYTWNLKPKLNNSEFTFKAKPGDIAIPFKKAAE